MFVVNAFVCVGLYGFEGEVNSFENVIAVVVCGAPLGMRKTTSGISAFLILSGQSERKIITKNAVTIGNT